MKVLINTNYEAAGTKVCVDDLSAKFKRNGDVVERNNWNNYSGYDLILFMSPDPEVRTAKSQSRAKVGLMDPKLTKEREPEVRAADFLLVSSIEQRDFFLKYNKNIFIYYMFPEIEAVSKNHKNKPKIIIGYHGNKKHLEEMEEVSIALDELSFKYNLELLAIYNIKNNGKWTRNRPTRCKVTDVQWSPDSYHRELFKADIGIIPAKVPIKHFTGFNVRKRYDYVMRFKYSNNPGRVYPFSQLGIPVIADFTPSYCQIIADGRSGLLAYSKEGWYWAIEKLILDHTLRQKLSDNMKEYINGNCSPDLNFKRFYEYLH